MSDLAENLERTAPLPPRSLAVRAGEPDPADVIASYRAVGRDSRATILELLGPSWSFRGKRVLDFGCGSGKVMRHFLPEAQDGELWGCDAHEGSVAWINEELSPPLHAFASGEVPPLHKPSATFDLVWSVSVFTHVTDHWAGWLSELHRVLKPGGLAIVSFLGRAMYEVFNDEPWEPDRIGMLVLNHGQGHEHGGATVFHSPWWLREHWGRAFEFVELREAGAPREHDLVMLRARPGIEVTPAELERIDAVREPREVDALQWQVAMLQREATALRAARDALALAQSRSPQRRLAGRLGQLRRGDG